MAKVIHVAHMPTTNAIFNYYSALKTVGLCWLCTIAYDLIVNY